jgi:hypothetical protein
MGVVCGVVSYPGPISLDGLEERKRRTQRERDERETRERRE